MNRKILGVVTLGLVVAFGACHKKSSSSGSSAATSSLAVDPPKAAVPVSENQTLTATMGGNLVNATWSVVSSSMGVLSAGQGDKVVFTAKNPGTAVITATANGQTAQCTLVILQPGQTPPPGSGGGTPSPETPPSFPQNLNLYNDAGGILGNPDVLLFTGGGLTIQELTEAGAPEGSKFLRSNAGPGGFWGISLDKDKSGNSANATALAGGALRFFIRLDRNLAANEVININLSDVNKTVSVPLGRDPNCTGDMTGWQEVVIPISNYSGIDLAHLTVPFAIAIGSPAGTPTLTFDIDNVRWTTNAVGASSMSVGSMATLACH